LQVASDYKPILRLKGKEINEISVSFVVQMSAIMLLGTCKAIWITIISDLIVGLALKKRLYKSFFNAGQCALSLLIAGYIFNLLKVSQDNVSLDIILDMPAIVVTVISYFLLNTFLISAAVSLTSGIQLFSVFFSDFNTLTYYFFTLPL